jgi:hypothetical protein
MAAPCVRSDVIPIAQIGAGRGGGVNARNVSRHFGRIIKGRIRHCLHGGADAREAFEVKDLAALMIYETAADRGDAISLIA